MKKLFVFITFVLIGIGIGTAGLAIVTSIYRAGIHEGQRMTAVSNHEVIRTYVLEYCTPWFDDKRSGILMACVAP